MDLFKNKSFVTKIVPDDAAPAQPVCNHDHPSTIQVIDQAITNKAEVAAVGFIKIYAAIRVIDTACKIALHIGTRS